MAEIMIAEAIAAFKDSAFPNLGIAIFSVAYLNTSVDIPLASLPIINTAGCINLTS